MRMTEIITASDMFGQGISLRIGEREKSKTLFGGILTIVSLILLSAMFFYSCMDMFFKVNPEIAIEEQISLIRPNLTLNKYTMPISIVFQDAYMNNFNIPRYFKMEAVKVSIFNTPNGAETFFDYQEFVRCSPEDFPLMTNETFYNSGLNFYYCLKDQNVTIGGFYDSKYTMYLALNLKLCRNSTSSNIICAPEEEIQNFMQVTPITGHYIFKIQL
jgi:hypothetical protein